jgi:HK97 family phage major capsid protein
VNEAQMRARVEEIDARLPDINTELLTLADSDLGETEATRFDALETEHTTLTEERAPLAARLAQIDRIRDTARTAAQAERAGNDDERSRSAGGHGVETDGGGRSRATRLDPFENLDAVRTNVVGQSDLRARALNAIEQSATEVFTDEQRERATELVTRNDQHGRIAKHMLLTGSDAYQRAFGKLLGGAATYQLESDELDALRIADSHRAGINEGTNTAGGFLVPFMVDPTILLQNASQTNPFREIANVVTITTNTWHGISTAGISAAWLAEAAETAQTDPVFAQPTIPTYKGSAYLQASFEAMQDTNIVNSLGMLLADAKDRLEATAHAVGTGTNQPQGIITGVSAVSGSVVNAKNTGNVFVADDVYALKGALPPRYRPNASWVASEAIYLLIRQFATGTGPQNAFWADLGMATPSLLLGRPTYESSVMAGALADAAKILLVGDIAKTYTIVDRIGMTVMFNPLVVGTANNRPTGESGWFAHWRTGGGVVNADASRVLKSHTA